MGQIGAFAGDTHLARIDLGQIEQVVQQTQHHASGIGDHLEVLALLGLELARQRQFGETDHAIHRRADFVAHIGEEGGLGLGSAFGGILGFDEFGFEPLGLVDVAQRGDDFLGRTGRRIAHQAAIRLEPVEFVGFDQAARTECELDAVDLAPAEAVETLLDPVVVLFVEARDQLRSDEQLRIDSEHLARRWRGVDAGPVEREPDHRIGGVVGEQRQLFFAPGELGLRGYPRGDVADDADISRYASARIANGAEDDMRPRNRAVLVDPADLVVRTVVERGRSPPFVAQARRVGRMQRRRPAPVFPFAVGEPGKRLPLLVDINDLSGRIGLEDADRRGFRKPPEARFAFGQRLRLLDTFGNVVERSDAASEAPLAIKERFDRDLDMADFPAREA